MQQELRSRGWAGIREALAPGAHCAPSVCLEGLQGERGIDGGGTKRSKEANQERREATQRRERVTTES